MYNCTDFKYYITCSVIQNTESQWNNFKRFQTWDSDIPAAHWIFIITLNQVKGEDWHTLHRWEVRIICSHFRHNSLMWLCVFVKCSTDIFNSSSVSKEHHHADLFLQLQTQACSHPSFLSLFLHVFQFLLVGECQIFFFYSFEKATGWADANPHG